MVLFKVFVVYGLAMIEIRKNSDPEVKRQALLFVDGVLLENAFVYIHSSDSCTVTSEDAGTSRKIATHAFSDFPIKPAYIALWFYFSDLEHFDKSSLYIYEWTNEQKGKDLLFSLTLGGDSLTQWKSPYTFADYVYEIYPILNGHKAVYEVDLYADVTQKEMAVYA